MLRTGLAALCLLGSSTAAYSTDARECRALAQAVPAGSYIRAELTRPVDCREESISLPLIFDRGTGEIRTTADLAQGAYLGPIHFASTPAFRAGQPLQLRFLKGAVAVARDVRLMAPARSGQRALVRTSDGSALLVRLEVSGSAPQ